MPKNINNDGRKTIKGDMRQRKTSRNTIEKYYETILGCCDS